MSGLAMPGGDPAALEQLANSLEVAAAGFGDLGRNTRQVTASVRSDAEWTGDAADSYTAFSSNLSQGAAAAEAPLSQIALLVRDYAGFLRTAQQKVAAYASVAEIAQVSGNDSAYVRVAEGAAQDAEVAVSAWQAAGNRVAAGVTSAAGQLGDVFGSRGPVQNWLGSQPVPLDTLAGIPGLGDPLMPQILKTPGIELGPEILKTPGAELGPEILITLPGEFGPEILITPPGDFGPEILKTPPGLLGPLLNYATQGPKTKEEIDEQAEILGYSKKIPPPKAPFNSHGMPVYFNGRQYLTPDRDSHNVDNGWKIFNRRGDRTGTWNWDLTERVKS